MGKFIVIDGGDGSGKATTTQTLKRLLVQNYKVETISFPRYNDTIAGNGIGLFLSGKTPKLSIKSIATLYALDRMESLEYLSELIKNNDYVIADRYVSSNMAYQGSKVPLSERDDLIEWIRHLEFDVFGLPIPDYSFFLNTSVELSDQLIAKKETRTYTKETYDIHEADKNLQENARYIYKMIADQNIGSPWSTINIVDNKNNLKIPQNIAQEILKIII